MATLILSPLESDGREDGFGVGVIIVGKIWDKKDQENTFKRYK